MTTLFVTCEPGYTKVDPNQQLRAENDRLKARLAKYERYAEAHATIDEPGYLGQGQVRAMDLHEIRWLRMVAMQDL